MALIPKYVWKGSRKRLLARWWYMLQGWSEEPILPAPSLVIESAASAQESSRRIAFTFAVIALSAKIVALDGKLSKPKYIAFREAFPLSGGICGKIRQLFALAYTNPTPFEHYVAQIKYAFPHQQELFRSLVDRLFSIAAADGSLSRPTEHMLAKIAHRLDIKPETYAEIRNRHMGALERRVFPTGMARATLKNRYRELMQRYHPDRFAAENLSPELQMLLQLKTSEINEAYRKLSRKAA